MKIKFWGVRGSIGSPLKPNSIRNKVENILSLATPTDIQSPESIKRYLNSLSFSRHSTYGGNTTSIEVRDKYGNLILIDSGTGIRELGIQLMSQEFGRGQGSADWIFTHSHWDHIQGFPFFIPLFVSGNEFRFHSAMAGMEERLRYQHNFTHFPVPFEGYKAKKEFFHHPEHSQFHLGDVRVSSKSMRHPGGCYSYKLEESGKSLVFASDVEFNLDEMDGIEEYIEYFANTDVLVFDTQYTFEESLQKIDWGHSTASIATDISLKAGVKKLVMFHHDPSYDDEQLDAVYLRALKYKEMFDPGGSLDIVMAYEGLELDI